MLLCKETEKRLTRNLRFHLLNQFRKNITLIDGATYFKTLATATFLYCQFKSDLRRKYHVSCFDLRRVRILLKTKYVKL